MIWGIKFFLQGKYCDLNSGLGGNRAELCLLKPSGPFEPSLLVLDIMKRADECLRTKKEVIYILNEG